MKAHAFMFLSGIQLSVVYANGLHGHHAHLKRQATSTFPRAIFLVFVSDALSPPLYFTSQHWQLQLLLLRLEQPYRLWRASLSECQPESPHSLPPPIPQGPHHQSRVLLFCPVPVCFLSRFRYSRSLKDIPVSLSGWPTQDKVPPTGSFFVILFYCLYVRLNTVSNHFRLEGG